MVSGSTPKARRDGRDFPGRRWLSVLLRGAHLIAVIVFGAAVLHVSPAALPEHAGSAVLITGALIWLLDLWHRPAHLIEGAGLSMVLKLLLVAWMIVSPGLREPLFWVIVGWSAVFSHAPSSFRNARPLSAPGPHLSAAGHELGGANAVDPPERV